MQIVFHCPRCEHVAHTEVDGATTALACPRCNLQINIPRDALSGESSDLPQLSRCLVCPCTDLFVRKDFPQRLGVAIVVAGFAASCVAWYFRWIYTTFGILFGTALVDLMLYLWCGEVLMCYACGAIYRRAGTMRSDNAQAHGAFDLSVHERYRQQAARLSQATSATRAGHSSTREPTLP